MVIESALNRHQASRTDRVSMVRRFHWEKSRTKDNKTRSKQSHLAKHSAVWAHFSSENSIDCPSRGEFRQRVAHVTREFSTVHFLYRGYWFWLIPQPEGVVSVGLVYDESALFSDGTPNQMEF